MAKPTVNTNEIPLNDKEIAVIGDLKQRMVLLQAQLDGALGMISVQRDLKMKYSLSEDGRKLIPATAE